MVYLHQPVGLGAAGGRGSLQVGGRVCVLVDGRGAAPLNERVEALSSFFPV